MNLINLFLVVFLKFHFVYSFNDSSIHNSVDDPYSKHYKSLSRRKRFLLFPEGSSFQLVFCVQTSALIPIGDIFLYGNTAALAWNLPTDPFLDFFKNKHGAHASRRGDAQKHIYYLNDKGHVINKVPYQKRHRIINPAFAKRSVDAGRPNKPNVKLDKKRMHKIQLERQFSNSEHMSEASVRFHRLSRLSLFEKFELFLEALGGDGRSCVLRKLCESSKLPKQQGTFLTELRRAVFTFPKSKNVLEEHKIYDEAAAGTQECSVKYSGCSDFSVTL